MGAIIVILGLIGLLIDSIIYIYSILRVKTFLSETILLLIKIFNNWEKDFEDDDLKNSFKSDPLLLLIINSEDYDINISIKIKSKY